MNSKRKGCAGEREFAALCRDHGIDGAQRGQQFKGGYDSPDVKGIPGIHAEVKRVEKLNITDAMNQSIRDSGGQGGTHRGPPEKPLPLANHHAGR